jgi:hypothetical protein
VTKRESQKSDYEAEVTHDVTARTCSTCHWWWRGYCVLHTGLKGQTTAKLDFGDMLKTAADFGCSEWRKDERPYFAK